MLPGALVAAAASSLAQSLMATPMPTMQTVKRIAKPLICMAFFFDDDLLRGSAVRSLHGLPGGIRTPFATAIGPRHSGRSTGRGGVERAAAAGVRPARSGQKKEAPITWCFNKPGVCLAIRSSRRVLHAGDTA